MILQALCEYYDRNENLPRFGFEERPIPFVVVLDGDGNYLNIEKTSETNGNKLVSKTFVVPSLPSARKASRDDVKSGLTSGLAWDHFGYVFGQPKIDKKTKTAAAKDIELADLQLEGFKARLSGIYMDLPDNKEIAALVGFYNNESNLQKVREHALWEEIIKKDRAYIAFRLAGRDHLICQSPAVPSYVRKSIKESANGLCLVTGEETEISRTHKSLNVPGGTNAKLVSFNQDAFESYGKSQSYNSPVGIRAGFKYSAALNYMLRGGSSTKFSIGATQYVCWADKPNRLESDTPLFLSFGDDDPDGTAIAVNSLFESIHSSGAYQENDGQDRFFVLGLAPNSARIVVRYWKAGTIKEFAENFARWFKDLELRGLDHYGYPTLKKLLRSTAPQFKDDNISPKLSSDVVRAILSGERLPETLIQAVLRRIRADKGKVSYTRACIIKAYLNRKYRFSTTKHKELTVSLDKQEARSGYCLGRLFAVLEKVQQDAQPGINTTIRDRYYSRASSTPKAVFGTLMRLSTHHLKKLENPGLKINAEKRISEVMELITHFPAHLNLENQGLFALGYYHQKREFYTKKIDHGEDE